MENHKLLYVSLGILVLPSMKYVDDLKYVVRTPLTSKFSGSDHVKYNLAVSWKSGFLLTSSLIFSFSYSIT